MSSDSSVVVRNIFYMLAYAYRALDAREVQDIGAEAFDNALDLLGAVYSKGLAAQIRRGLDQSYADCTDDLPCARGRVNVRASLDATHRQRLQLRCSFSEMTRDTPLNRLVKYTGYALLASGELRAETQASIRALLPYLSDIALVSVTQARQIKPQFTRLNRSYQLLVSVCHFAMGSLLPDESSGGSAFSRIIDSQALNRLYERFILEYFRKHHAAEVSANASKVSWNATGKLPAFLPGMKTDVMLCGKGDKAGRTLILDAKCYSKILTDYHGKAMISPANVYQIYSYVKNADVSHSGNVGGMLLYALTDEEGLGFAPGRREWVLDGNRFEVRTVDLGAPFPHIAAQLDDVLEAL